MSKETERWDERCKAFHESMRKKFDAYRRYCRWFAGDYSDVAKDMSEEENNISPVNMVALVARANRAHLFFNSPRVVVKPQPTMSADPYYNDKLAKVLTHIANDIFEETGLYNEGRRMLLDCFLGPYMVAKVGYNLDIRIDSDKMKKEKERGEQENQSFLSGGRPRVRAEDNHHLHIEAHEHLSIAIRDGDFKTTDEVFESLASHIDQHYRMARQVSGDPVSEVERGERVFIRRKRPDWVSFDIWANNIHTIRWITETTVRTVDEVKNDPRYNTNRSKVKPSGSDSAAIDIFTNSERERLARDQIVIIRECIDLHEGVVATYPIGADFLLREVEYGYRDILPSGPYVFGVSCEDPRELGFGISQPSLWEPQQRDLALLNTVKVATAKAAVPGMAYDGEYISDEDVTALSTAVLLRKVKCSNLGEKKISDVYGPIPTPTISGETFAISGESMSLIERLSAMGAVRLGGGDRAKTATASELVNEAISAMTQEMAVMVDRTMLTLARYSLRLAKSFYRLNTVRSIAGDVAIEVWPEKGFTRGEIFDDRGIEIVAGTMRRASTDIEMKLLGDLYSVMVKDPAVPVEVRLQLLDYLTTLYGAPIDLGGALEAARKVQAQMSSGGSPLDGMGGAPTAPNDMAQGVANVGGGRLPTGASKGDKPRMMR